MYEYQYPHPAVSVDCVVLALDRACPHVHGTSVLLIQRDREPYAGAWALPGGFVDIDEDLEAAAHRELAEETGIRGLDLEQLRAFGDPGRDPRERVISIAYIAVVGATEQPLKAGSDARQTRWFSTNELPPLAFDHASILRTAMKWLETRLRSGSHCAPTHTGEQPA